MLSTLLAVVLAAVTLVYGALATYYLLARLSLRQGTKAKLFFVFTVILFTPVWVPVDITLAVFLPSAVVLGWLTPAVAELSAGPVGVVNLAALVFSILFFAWQTKR